MRLFNNIVIAAFVVFVVYCFRADLQPLAQALGTYAKDITYQLEGKSIPVQSKASPIPQITNSPQETIPATTTATASSPSAVSTVQSDQVPSTGMTAEAIIYWTNYNREQNGLPPLTENSTLDGTALAKANDMFAKQYFAHVSPSGVTVATQVQAVGYDYILIGENLALGDFPTSEAILTAWMNSPEHRANILNTHYIEMGAALVQGVYQGNTVWIAVQHFGLPASSCPSVDASLKQAIDSGQTGITSLLGQINTQKQEITSSNELSLGYNSLINTYNTLVNQYNSIVTNVKSQIATYNTQVTSYNNCLNAAGE